jgi:hypothetical protein
MEYIFVVLGLVGVAGLFAVLQKTFANKPKAQVTRLDL